MLKEYNIASNEIDKQGALFEKVKKKVTQTIENFANNIDKMNTICNQLSKIALRANTYKQTEYIDELIASERSQRSYNFIERIEMLEDMKKRFSVVSQLVDGKFNIQAVLGPLKEDIESIDYKKMTWFEKKRAYISEKYEEVSEVVSEQYQRCKIF